MRTWRTLFKNDASDVGDTRSDNRRIDSEYRGAINKRGWVERDAIDSDVGHSCHAHITVGRNVVLLFLRLGAHGAYAAVIAGRGAPRSDHRATRGPSQEPGSDQHVEDITAIVGVKAPQLDCLRLRQLQAGHFQEFTTHPVDDCGEAHFTRIATGGPLRAAHASGCITHVRCELDGTLRARSQVRRCDSIVV